MSSEPQNTSSSPNPLRKKSTSNKDGRIGHRVAFWFHSFLGLKLSIMLSIVLISGTLAVFAAEIDWLIYSEMRVSPQGEKLQEGEIYDRMQAAMPNTSLSNFSSSTDTVRTAAQAMMTPPEGGFKKVWADPYTGEITGITSFLTVGQFISVLHTNLFMPLIGRAFVNMFGLFCLISLITGLIYYKQFWKGFFKFPRWKAKSRVLLADLHKFIGVWSLWFVLIIGVTGTWWFYWNPLVFYKVAPPMFESLPIEPGLTKQDIRKLGDSVPQRLSSKEIVDAVKQHDPDFVVHLLTKPEHNGMAYTVRGTKYDLLTQKWDSAYYVHPYTGEILGSRLAEDFSTIRRVDRAMEPLHYGTFAWNGWADLFVKTIWFIFGAGMSALSISGMLIYYKRTKRATEKLLPKTGKKRHAKKIWFTLRPWGGSMSGFKYLNVAFVAVMCIGISIGFKLQNEGVQGSGYQYTSQELGPWTVSLNATRGLLEKDLDPIAPGIRTNFNAFIEAGDAENIKFMYVKTKKPRTKRAPGFVIHGPVGFQHAHFRLPENLKDDAKLWLTIESWDGEFYQTSWPLMPDGELTVDLRSADDATTGAIGKHDDQPNDQSS